VEQGGGKYNEVGDQKNGSSKGGTMEIGSIAGPLGGGKQRQTHKTNTGAVQREGKIE